MSYTLKVFVILSFHSFFTVVTKPISIEIIAANLFLFYVAGYETTASIASFTAFELAQSPVAMAKAQHEVREALGKHDNKFTYMAVQDMKYLDLCILGKN